MASSHLQPNPVLPEPKPNQAYIEVSALEAGIMHLPMFFLKDASPDEDIVAPSLAFSLRHVPSGEHLVFDLGLRRDPSTFPPIVQGVVEKYMPYTVPQTVDESLKKGGIEPKDVKTVILSHLHWDHIGGAEPFVNATFVLGGGARALLENAYPANPRSDILQSSVPLDRTRFLPDSAFDTSVGPFPRAHDYFGDGSLYLIDAVGHLAGHLNILARTSATGSWINLTGNSAHDRRMLTDRREGNSGHPRSERPFPLRARFEGGRCGDYPACRVAIAYSQGAGLAGTRQGMVRGE